MFYYYRVAFVIPMLFFVVMLFGVSKELAPMYGIAAGVFALALGLIEIANSLKRDDK